MTSRNNRFTKAALATAAGTLMMLGSAGVASAQTSQNNSGISYTPYAAVYEFFSCRTYPNMVWCR